MAETIYVPRADGGTHPVKDRLIHADEVARRYARANLSTAADYPPFPNVTEHYSTWIDASKRNDFMPENLVSPLKFGCMTYTYFIQREDGGPIKIGKSKDIARRLEDFKGGCPVPLVCIAYIQGDWEAHAHKKFIHLCIAGEWFQDAPELMKFILEWATPANIRCDPASARTTKQRADGRVEWMTEELWRTRRTHPIWKPRWTLEVQ